MLKKLLIVIIGVLFAASLVSGAVLALSQTRDSIEVNGLSIDYTITGANLDLPVDSVTFGYIQERDLTGSLAGDTLSISGTVSGINGSWTADIWVGVGGYSDTWSQSLTSFPAGSVEPFAVSVTIPKGAQSGSFYVRINYDSSSTTEINYLKLECTDPGLSGVAIVTTPTTAAKTTAASGSAPVSNPPGSSSGSAVPWLIGAGVVLGVTLFTAGVTIAIIAQGPVLFGEGVFTSYAVWLSTNSITGPVIAFLYSGLSKFTLTNIPLLKLAIDKLYQTGPYMVKSLGETMSKPGWHIPRGGSR
jgi:hypothetical protein